MNERKLFQNGITLIALVISIIVMLILAGVSLNATIGDNGIITQAQNATYMQSIAVLEEFMQQKYVELYGKIEEPKNKIEYFLKDVDGTGKYIQKAMNNNNFFVDSSGNTYYFIDKNNLPDEIKNQIKGGDNKLNNTIWADFNDIYGITTDLKVYYCNSSKDDRIGAEDEVIKATDFLSSKVTGMEKGTEWAKTLGFEKDVTYNDLLNVTEINITNSNLDLSYMSNLGSLTRVNFIDVTKDNINGIGNASNLNYVFFNNSKIGNYSDLGRCNKLQRLYVYFPKTMNENDTNNEIATLCSENRGIANADLNKLEYFGIFGYDYFTEITQEPGNAIYHENRSNLTNISQINNLKSKKYIKYLYLNDNRISSLEALSGFENLYLLLISNNRELTTFNGLQNLQNLKYIYAQYCNLENTKGLGNCTGLYYLKLTKNINLKTLNDLEQSKDLTYIYAEECALGKDENIEINSDEDALACLKNLEKIQILNFKENDLKRVEYLKNFNNITAIYLEGNENINGESLLSIKDVIYRCGNHCSFPSKFSLLMLDENTTNLSLKGQNVNKENFILLKNKLKLEKLDLSELKLIDNNSIELSTEETNNLINEVLSTLTSVKYLNLEKLSKLSTIEFTKNMPNLIEIVLYDTNVITGTVDVNGEYTGLELLNNNLKLESLAINNENIELGKIVTILNRLKDDYAYAPSRFLELCGLYAKNSKMFESLNKPDIGLEKIGLKMLDVNSIIDLRNCNSLKKVTLIYGSKYKIQLPDSVEKIYFDGQYLYGEYPKNLKYSSYINSGLDDDVLANLAKNCSKLESISTGNSNGQLTNLDGFSNAIFKTSLKTLNLTNNGHQQKSYINNIKGLTGYTALEYLKIEKAEVSDLSGIQTMLNLKELYLNESNVNSLELLKDNINLQIISLASNRIASLHGLENLKNLRYLDLQNNCLQDLVQYVDENNESKLIRNLSIVKALNKNNGGNLSTLLLAGNSNLTDFSEISNLNWTNKNGF